MLNLVTISLGYITIPFFVKRTIKALDITSVEDEDESESSSPQWTFGNTICITSFVQSPPNIYPTTEKHILQIAPHSNQAEKETLSTLSRSLNESCHGLVLLSADLLGILSATTQSDVFTFQVVEFDSNILTDESILKEQHSVSAKKNKSYSAFALQDNAILDLDNPPKPLEIMELCLRWPASESQLSGLAKQIYKTASLYGYWDYWRVFEGICNGHRINSQQLIS